MGWLSVGGTPGAERIRATGATGWVRPDGKPFANTVDQILAGKTFYPPRIDDQLRDITKVSTMPTHKYALTEGACPNASKIGTPDAEGPRVIAAGTVACGVMTRVYCFQTDHQAQVAPVAPAGARRAFLSNNPASLFEDITTFDTVCQFEATSVYGTNAFIALTAPNMQGARDRLPMDGRPWIRPDNVVVATDLAGFEAPLSMTTSTDRIPSAVWFGAPDPVTPGDAMSNPTTNCDAWTYRGGLTVLGDSHRSAGEAFAATPGQPCNLTTPRLYCFER